MKILFVDLKYDYGDPNRGPNDIGQNGFSKSFIDLGHEVEHFYYDNYLGKDLKLLQKDLIEKALSLEPDLVFFILFMNHFELETLGFLKQRFTTVNWFGDDTWRFETFTSVYAPHFTYAITTDKWSIEKYQKLSPQPRVIRSQWASLEFEIQEEKGVYEYDVSFIGGANSVRKWFVSELLKKGINVECFGFGWPNGSVSNQQMSKIFNRSKINLNLSNSNTLDVRYLMSSAKALYHSFRSIKTAPQIKARNFEIPYCGGFQLTDYVPGIEDYFQIGRELVCYKDVNEASFLINYYLRNEIEREEIRQRCIERVRNEHTYKIRIAKIFDDIEW